MPVDEILVLDRDRIIRQKADRLGLYALSFDFLSSCQQLWSLRIGQSPALVRLIVQASLTSSERLSSSFASFAVNSSVTQPYSARPTNIRPPSHSCPVIGAKSRRRSSILSLN